jgi:hypothetical protein
MTLGTHTVTVYPDRSAGSWSPPLASNPYFTSDGAGWLAQPFTNAWVWSGGQLTGGSALGRSDTAPVLRPAGARQWRLRARFTVGGEGDAFWGLNFGKTAHGAWAGAYWAPDEAAPNDWWGGLHLTAGTYTIDQTWDTGENVPDVGVYPYVGPYLFVDANTMLPCSVDSLELLYVGAPGVDFTCLCDAVTINHGRDDATGQPEASSATVDLSRDPTGRFPLPPELEIGAVVKVVTNTANASSQRFVGRVTDLTLGWEDDGAETPDAAVGQVVCTGLLDDTARRVIGDVPWPQELDGARVSRIMTAAGITLDPLFSDPGHVAVLARDVDSQPALDVARQTAESASGVVWQTRDGEIRYADSEHRRGQTSTLTLDACDLLVTPSWRRTLEGLVNSVSIGYGVDAEGGEQPRVLMSNQASIDRYGTYGLSAATMLATLADAQAMASLLMGRNSTPVWLFAALPVDVPGLDESRTTALLGLDMHSLLAVTGLPAVGSAPTSALLWVEGWRETLTADSHEFELVVSGYCRTVPPPRWDDMNPGWTWDTMPADITWDSATCIGPPTDFGRWNDVPASLRWDAVPATTTWDTWDD